MRLLPRSVLLAFAVCLCGMSTTSPPPPSLGSAASFVVLGGAAVNAGSSAITGNLGVSPGKTITGSPAVTLGKIYRNDATARQAQKDAAAAYSTLAARTCGSALTGQDLGGKTLAPGVYCFASSARLMGNLKLDAGGSKEAVWIFLIAGDLTTSADSAVSVVNGGSNGNVFWQVGGSATLGEHAVFAGSILALANITLMSGASVSGRVLARTGAVTLDTNAVSVCCNPIIVSPSALPSGMVDTAYAATLTASGGAEPYTFRILSGILPPGLALALTGELSGRPAAAETGVNRFTVVATDAHGCSGIGAYEIVVCPITILTATLPNGKVGMRYGETITACGGKGPPYVFSVTGLLPPGLTLDPVSGAISGAPTTAGSYTFTVTASDGACSGSRTYTLVICGIAITTATLPGGSIGTPHSETIATAGGVGTLTFSAHPTAPTGLTLDPVKGIISGTPSAAGCFTFTVTVTDALGCSASRTYTICICPRALALTDLPPDGTVAMAYRETITASLGVEPYRFTVSAGGLPTGLDLHEETGVVDGTPIAAGKFSFTVRATDARGCTGSRDYAIVIDCPLVVLSPPVVPPATLGEFYCQTLIAAGAIGPYAFSVTGGSLPSSLTLSPDGVLSGIPSVVTSFAVTPSMPVPPTEFTVTAIDKTSGCMGQETYAVVVVVCGASIVISPPTPALPDGIAGRPYSQTITAGGGTGTYRFAATCGTLPAGLALSPGGLLSGIPPVAGTYLFTVTATDPITFCSSTRSYTMVIVPEVE